tara:strand:- start:326 stop:556 length:231 start_codon:yes stop_codon:yes gene_type:complete
MEMKEMITSFNDFMVELDINPDEFYVISFRRGGEIALQAEYDNRLAERLISKNIPLELKSSGYISGRYGNIDVTLT